MPLVVSVADIRDALAYDALPTINTAIRQAIDAAQQSVSDTVRSSFERGTVTDEFWVNNVLKFGGQAPQVELLMSQGFIDSAQTYNVYAAGAQKDLATASTRLNLKALSGVDHATFDFDTGLLRVTDYDISKCYVRIEYTAGFNDDSGDPPIYEGTPEWLKQAVRLKTQLVLDANPILPRPQGTGEGDGGAGAKILVNTLSNITMAHSRYVPGSWKPYRSF